MLRVVGEEKIIDEPQSKHDFIFRGKTIKLLLEPCDCGVKARWVIEMPFKSTLPEFLQNIIPDQEGKKTIFHTLDEWHFHPTWFQKYILRQKLEKELKKWVNKTKKRFESITSSEKNIKQLMDLI
jgi:hypothetical protein